MAALTLAEIEARDMLWFDEEHEGLKEIWEHENGD